MIIRRAIPRDARALTTLAHAAKRHWRYPDAWMAAWRPGLTLRADQIARWETWVACEGGTPIAFYALAPAPGGCALEHFWVRPDRIGRDVGRRLFEHAIATARTSGAAAMRIEADPNARVFYKRMGAVPCGEVAADLPGVRRSLPLLERTIPG